MTENRYAYRGSDERADAVIKLEMRGWWRYRVRRRTGSVGPGARGGAAGGAGGGAGGRGGGSFDGAVRAGAAAGRAAAGRGK